MIKKGQREGAKWKKLRKHGLRYSLVRGEEKCSCWMVEKKWSDPNKK